MHTADTVTLSAKEHKDSAQTGNNVTVDTKHSLPYIVVSLNVHLVKPGLFV